MKLGAIIVLYNPDISLLKNVIESVSKQVDNICVVDNSSHVLEYSDLFNIEYIYLGNNKGLAYAQNIGINYMLSIAVDYILFLDQDSILPSNAVSILLERYIELTNSKIPVAAIGPMPINRLTRKNYSIQVKSKELCCEKKDVIETFAVMSSGSLIAGANFKKIGLYNYSLFIDAVDYEWCWRAYFMYGYRSFVVKSLFMEHQLGRPGKLLGRNISISSPMRLYYQFRNCIWLLKEPYTPTFWKMKVLRKYSLKLFAYPLFISPKRSNLCFILKGIRDGVLEKMSKL